MWGALPLVACVPAKKLCTHCGKEFSPRTTFQTVCKPACLLKSINQAEKMKKERKKLDRMMDKAKREGLKTVPELKKAAQVEFNKFIRERDKQAGHPCISCGKPLDWGSEGIRSHSVDCGHYRSTGSADHLRFDERNAHAQCVACNRYGAGRAVDYRIGLVNRIGLDVVEALEADNEIVKWDREVLRVIATTYRGKTRDLKRREA